MNQQHEEEEKYFCVSIRMEFMQFLWLHGEGLRDGRLELSSRCCIFVAIITVSSSGTSSDGFQQHEKKNNCLIDSLLFPSASRMCAAAHLMVIWYFRDNAGLAMMMIKMGAAPPPKSSYKYMIKQMHFTLLLLMTPFGDGSNMANMVLKHNILTREIDKRN